MPTLNHTPAEILQAILTADSDSLFTLPTERKAWPIYLSFMPDGPNDPPNVAAVYDTPGIIKKRLLASGTVLPTYGIQIKASSRDYGAAHTRLEKTAKNLSKISRLAITLNGSQYRVDTLNQTSVVAAIGYDQLRRSTSVVNFLMFFLQ